jgi:hypothetical protein
VAVSEVCKVRCPRVKYLQCRQWLLVMFAKLDVQLRNIFNVDTAPLCILAKFALGFQSQWRLVKFGKLDVQMRNISSVSSTLSYILRTARRKSRSANEGV